ncbi:MAG: DUF5063 domain-containing protein [Verrucomicrobia bacterium]|nr:DUF5063 domain-containing protein [Prolixibacteraceae bacterium]
MREEELNSIAYSKNVIEFITVANEYCSFLERSADFESPVFLSRLQKILPLLYLKASLLPEFEFEPEDELEKFVTEVDYNLIQENVLLHTGGGDDYQEVFLSGMQFSESALTSRISENIADIYQEMKDLVMSFRTMNDEVMAQAIWECRNNFANLWGQTLVNCLRAVHNLMFSDKTEDDQKPAKKDKKESNKKGRNPDWLNDRFSNQGE